MAKQKQEQPRKVYSGKMEPWLEASIKEAEAFAEELWAILVPQRNTPEQQCPPEAPKKRSRGKKKAKDS